MSFLVKAGELIQFKKPKAKKSEDYSFRLSEQQLQSNDPLTVGEWDKIDKEIDRVSDLIDQCGDHDQDVLESLLDYMEKIEDRVQRSIDRKVGKDKAKAKKKLKLIKAALQRY